MTPLAPPCPSIPTWGQQEGGGGGAIGLQVNHAFKDFGKPSGTKIDEFSGKFMTMMMRLFGGDYNDCDNDDEDDNYDDGSDPPQ